MKTERWLLTVAFFIITLSIFHSQSVTDRLVVYQERWAPALTLACTGKFGLPDLSQVAEEERGPLRKKLSAFLNRKPVRRFDCKDFPPQVAVKDISEASNHWRFFYRFQVGLMTGVGLLWKLWGPDWQIVGLISSMFGAATALTLYATARFFVGIVPSAIIATSLVTWQINLIMLGSTRDYGKTFFTLLAFYALLTITMRSFHRRWGYWLACLSLGLFMGLSVSFRQDMTAVALLSLVLLIAFPPVFSDSKNTPMWQSTPPAVLLFALGFLALVVPLYALVPVDHSHEGHFLILGLYSRAFDNAQFSTGEVLFSQSYQDYAAYVLIQAYAIAHTGEELIKVFSETYNTLSVTQFLETALVVPFMIVGRIYTILFDIISSKSQLAPAWGGTSFYWVLLVNSLTALTITFFRNQRLFFFFLMFFSAIAAMLSLQYMARHTFHVHMLWFAIASSINLSALFMVIKKSEWFWQDENEIFARSTLSLQTSKQPWWWSSIITTVFVAVPLIAFGAQLWTFERWKGRVTDQPVVSAPVTVESKDKVTEIRLIRSGNILDFRGEPRSFETLTKSTSTDTTGGYLAVKFKSKEQCGHDVVSLHAKFETEFYYYDVSQKAEVSLHETQPTVRYLPAFFMDKGQFVGLDISSGANCFDGMSWVKNFQKIRLPISFNVSN